MTIPKFRVYDKVECMMITTSDYEDLSDLFCFLKADADTGYYSELMQSTGLFDRNGVEIFEGDIVAGGKVTYLQKFGSWMVVFPDGDSEDLCDFTNVYEVIGNIYENPELVEVEVEKEKLYRARHKLTGEYLSQNYAKTGYYHSLDHFHILKLTDEEWKNLGVLDDKVYEIEEVEE